MLFRIRAAQASDAHRLANLLLSSFYFPDDRPLRWWESYWRALLGWSMRVDLLQRLNADEKCYSCLVAIGDANPAEIVAVVEVSLRCVAASPLLLAFPWLGNGDRVPYAFNLAVDARWRRQGIAARLLSACEAIAATWGFSRAYLHVTEDNQPALALYARLGYRQERIERDAIATWIGRPRRLLLSKEVYRVGPCP